NSLLAPLDGVLLWNRLAWVALAVSILAIAFHRFRFAHESGTSAARRGRRKGAAAVDDTEPPGITLPAGGAPLPQARPEYGFAAPWAQFLSIARQSFRGIVRNRYFLASAGGGVLFMILVSQLLNEMYGTTIWPVTYAMLEILGANFRIFMLIVITLYAGDLIWAERDARINQVVDATPVRGWVPLAGKWVGLALMLVVLQAVVMATGILLQAVQGYTNFEVGLY